MLAATVATALLAGSARAADPPVAGVLDALTVTTTGGTAGGADALIRGNHPDAGSGSAVAFAGDFNGDRRPDYVTTARRRTSTSACGTSMA